MNELLNRLLLGVPILGFFLFSLLYLPPFVPGLFWVLILFQIGRETRILLGLPLGTKNHLWIALLMILSLIGMYVILQQYPFFSVTAFLVFSLGVACLLFLKKEDGANALKNEKHFILFFFCWGIIPLGLLMALCALEGGTYFAVAFILSVALLDTFSYFGGKLFGRRKLAPSISPGKTYEGGLAGIVSCVAGGMALVGFLGLDGDWFRWILIFLAVAVSSIFGDLAESKLKRLIGVKNSSRALGAHGGIMDRSDSYIFSTPIYYGFLYAGGFFHETKFSFFASPYFQ